MNQRIALANLRTTPTRSPLALSPRPSTLTTRQPEAATTAYSPTRAQSLIRREASRVVFSFRNRPPCFRSESAQPTGLQTSTGLQQQWAAGGLFALPGIETFLATNTNPASGENLRTYVVATLVFLGVSSLVLLTTTPMVQHFLEKKRSSAAQKQVTEALDEYAPALLRDMPKVLQQVAQLGQQRPFTRMSTLKLEARIQHLLAADSVAETLVELLSIQALDHALNHDQVRALIEINRRSYLMAAIERAKFTEKELLLLSADKFYERLWDRVEYLAVSLSDKLESDLPLLPTADIQIMLLDEVKFQGIDHTRRTYTKLRKSSAAMKAAYDRLPPEIKSVTASPTELLDKVFKASIAQWIEELKKMRKFYRQCGKPTPPANSIDDDPSLPSS